MTRPPARRGAGDQIGCGDDRRTRVARRVAPGADGMEVVVPALAMAGGTGEHAAYGDLAGTAVVEGRQRVTATFGDFWVVSREGLLRLKAISGRTRDLADIERLAELAELPDHEVAVEGQLPRDPGNGEGVSQEESSPSIEDPAGEDSDSERGSR